jgi:hypothetical protein
MVCTPRKSVTAIARAIWRPSAFVGILALIASPFGSIVSSAPVSAAPVATQGHTLTANPTCVTEPGATTPTVGGCIEAWSNGLTFSWTGYAEDADVAWYEWASTSAAANQSAIESCDGPDFAIFVPLSAGEYTAGELLPSAAGNPNTVHADLVVGAAGSTEAPAAECAGPPETGAPACFVPVDLPVVAMAPAPDGKGYFLAGADGTIQNFGDANSCGFQLPPPLRAPIVGIASASDGDGAWEVASDGGVFAWGDAQFYGSAADLHLDKPIVGMAATPDGKGYLLVASDGGVFTYGDARFFGSAGGLHLDKPIVGIAATPDGNGYYLVASDGGIFTYGDAHFRGSTGGVRLDQPVVGMSLDSATGGYWEIARDGGVFSFHAPFLGSTGGVHLAAPIEGVTSTPSGRGYRFTARDGGVFDFGDAQFYGSAAGNLVNRNRQR